MLEQIGEGKFKDLSRQAEMILDEGESCCVVVKGCWNALYYASAAGRVMPGQIIRSDGLRKKDCGTLHITDKRVCFVGRAGAITVQLRKLLRCDVTGDAIHFIREGRRSAAHFIVESQDAIEVLRAATLKLAEMAKAGVKPRILPA